MYLKVSAPYCLWPKVASKLPLPESETWQVGGVTPLTEADAQKALIAQLQQQVQLSSLLNQINNQIRSTLDLQEILASACQLLCQAVKCSRVSILVKESEVEEVLITRGEYTTGNYPTQLGLKVPLADNAHLQILVCSEGPVAVTNFPDFPGLGEQTKELVKTLEIKSMLATATRYQGRVNGIIGLHQCDRHREWTEAEQQLLEGVASQLALAINQAKLYSETRRQAERESLLRLVSNQIRSTLDLNTILQTAVREVRQLLNTDRVVIYQFKDNWQGEIVVEDLITPWPSIFGNMIADNCFSGEYAQLYQQGRVKAIDDIHHAGLDSCHVNFLANLQVKANLIVPIIINSSEEPNLSLTPADQAHPPNRLWGLLIAHECHQPRTWHFQEIELLAQLGEQMAIAIQQAELYAQVRQAAIQSQAQAQQLKATLEALQATQQQLIQSEKMSSLGQMVAGIAHEINNANNFIHANLFHAQEYARTLSDALDYCAAVGPEATAAVESFNEEEDLNYIRSDFPKLLKSMREGSERIRSIVVNLRNFARLDEAEFKPVDLHEGIESSLALLQNRLQSSGIKIHKHYSTLPPVECHAGQINQVFFNLIHNALDAIEAAGTVGELTLRTWQSSPDWVTLSIRDNGIGISPEIQDRIFDPFFTRKPVGQGTGLGLSVCYQVVVQGHGGKIYYVSECGKGTEFIVELPIGTVD
ncbi:MAG: GAF domain-containing protein [Actinomycetota bacterium]